MSAPVFEFSMHGKSSVGFMLVSVVKVSELTRRRRGHGEVALAEASRGQKGTANAADAALCACE